MERIVEEITAAMERLQNQQENTRISQSQRPMRTLKDSEVTAILQSVGIPKRYLSAKKSDIPSLYWKLTESYRSDQREGLYIHGLRGCGKTHLAAALIRARIESVKVSEDIPDASMLDPNIIWISTTDLLLEIKRSFKSDIVTEDDVIERYTKVKYLTLDDIGVEKVTDWVAQVFYTIIDRRYREMQKTVITSNLTLDQLACLFGDRIASRIAGMCDIIEIKGQDRRIKRQ